MNDIWNNLVELKKLCYWKKIEDKLYDLFVWKNLKIFRKGKRGKIVIRGCLGFGFGDLL